LQRSGWNPSFRRSYNSQFISVISPSLLFEDAEYQMIESNLPKPPVLVNPIGMK
jgi:hypothetical protein